MKKKAFTLTELLVVVVIIGTLAAVVLPKFTKVLETRKTTEAENIMQAIRTEQEARCTLDKNYATDLSELAAGPTSTSSNYTYAFNPTGTGIEARSRSKDYTLKINSYANGGICCEGDYCSKLNKSYPSCGAYVPNEADNACMPEGVEPEPEPEPEPTCTKTDYNEPCSEVKGEGWKGTITYTVNASCEYEMDDSGCTCVPPTSTTDTTSQTCGCKGTKKGTRTFNTESCSWGEWKWGTCEEEETDCCDDSHYEGQTDRSEACGPCGKLNYVWMCKNNHWVSIPRNGCEIPDGFSNECTPGATETDTSESTPKTRTCSDTCAWGDWISGCEHGTRPDGTCKQPKYGWQLNPKAQESIPSCPYSNVTNPTPGQSMPPEICYNGACPEGSTITQPGVRCNGCNEQTGPYACFDSVTTSLGPYLGEDRYNYCNFVTYNCLKNKLIGYE